MTLRSEGPTPSTTTNQLINLCEDVLNGQAPVETLGRALMLCRDGLEAARTDFVTQVEQAGEGQMAALEEEIDDVLFAFDAYQKSLKTIERYLKDRKPSHIQGGIEEVTAATMALLSALAGYEDKELVESGPSENHYVNLLVRLAKRVVTGELDPEQYLAMIANAEKVMDDSLAGIRQERDPAVVEEVEGLQQAGRIHQEAIALFREFASSNDPATLEQAAAKLERASTEIKEGLLRVSVKRLTTGPSKSPYVNLALNAVKAFSENAIPLDSYNLAVADFKKILLETHLEFQKLASIRINSVQMQEEIERIAAAIKVHDEFAEEMMRCRSPEEARGLLARSGTFTEAANAFTEGFQSLLALSDRENKIVCVRCEHYNPPDARVCEKCHAALPKLAEPQMLSTFAVQESGDPLQRAPGDMPITQEMHQLFTAVNQVAEGEIPVEEFLTVVTWMDGYVNTMEHNVRTYVTGNLDKVQRSDAPPEEKQQVMEALNSAQRIVMEGAEVVRNGLLLMRHFTNELNRDYLIEGVRAVWHGFQQIYELQQAVESAKEARSA